MNESESKLKLYQNRVKNFDTAIKALIRQKQVSPECNEALRLYWAELVYHEDRYKPERVNAIIAPNRLASIAITGSEIITPPLNIESPLVLTVVDAPFRDGDNLVVPIVKSLDVSKSSGVVVPVFNPNYGEPYTNVINFIYHRPALQN